MSFDPSRNLPRIFALCAALSIAGSFSPGAASPLDPAVIQRMDSEISDLQKDSGFVGFSVAVVDRDGVLYSRGFGLADRAASVPFTDRTVLNIGSVSKTLIGVALARALERDLVDLDAPLEEYLPYPVRHPEYPDVAITLRQLATHTSSIVDRPPIYRKAYSKGEVAEMELGEYLRRYLAPDGDWFDRKNFGAAAPGTAYEYSNIAAALAAHALERVMGKPFSELTRETILTPLGMTDSGWSYATAERSRHAKLYDGRKLVKPYTLVTYPDGGLRTSAASLARYLTAIIRGGEFDGARVLEPASVAAMLAGQLSDREPPVKLEGLADSGLFWGRRSNGLIGHTGGDPGIGAFMFFDPDSGCGRLFLTNTEVKRKNADDFKAVWDVLKGACASP